MERLEVQSTRFTFVAHTSHSQRVGLSIRWAVQRRATTDCPCATNHMSAVCHSLEWIENRQGS